MEYIKSPINYTGNKYRLLPQFEKFLPKKVELFVDLFCGGATIGINVEADKIVMIDNNPRVISLLKFLASEDLDYIIKNVENLIKKYDLSYSAKNTFKYYREKGYVEGNNGLKNFNKVGYYKLRTDYNMIKNKSSKKANIYLYILMMYSFNNDIRFNCRGEFNLPVGKTDFNNNNLKKLKEYSNRMKTINVEFICANFNDKKVLEYLEKADFLYVDPPYLITTAVYNEESGWNEVSELELINLLDTLNKKRKKFALSNVLYKRGKVNEILTKWIESNDNLIINEMDYHYKSSSYNKIDREANEMEILLTNEV